MIGVGGFARAICCCVGAGVGTRVGDAVVGAGVGAVVRQCVAVQCAHSRTAPMKSEQQIGHHERTEQWWVLEQLALRAACALPTAALRSAGMADIAEFWRVVPPGVGTGVKTCAGTGVGPR